MTRPAKPGGGLTYTEVRDRLARLVAALDAAGVLWLALNSNATEWARNPEEGTLARELRGLCDAFDVALPEKYRRP